MADGLLRARSSPGGAVSPLLSLFAEKFREKLQRGRYNPVCMKAEAVERVLHRELLSPGPQRAIFKGARAQTPAAHGSLRALLRRGPAPRLPPRGTGLGSARPARSAAGLPPKPRPAAGPREGAAGPGRGLGRATLLGPCRVKSKFQTL